MPDLAIVIPVYNEGESFRSVFKECQKKVKTNFTIYAIYDFDEDTTVPVIEKLTAQYPDLIRGIKNYYGKGAVNALKTGLEVAGEPVVLVTMGDLSDDLADADKMFDLINKRAFDLVCGSRYVKGGRQLGGGLVKSFLSKMVGLSLHLLIGVPTYDISNSFKMYRKSLLQAVKIESNGGFEVGMEITVKAYLAGHKITEVPTTWRDRASGRSNFKILKWAPAYLRWYFTAILGKIKQLFKGKK